LVFLQIGPNSIDFRGDFRDRFVDRYAAGNRQFPAGLSQQCQRRFGVGHSCDAEADKNAGSDFECAMILGLYFAETAAGMQSPSGLITAN